MQINLDDRPEAGRKKARRFAEDELIPHEVEAEMNAGKLPRTTSTRHKNRAIELGFSAMDVPASYVAGSNFEPSTRLRYGNSSGA